MNETKWDELIDDAVCEYGDVSRPDDSRTKLRNAITSLQQQITELIVTLGKLMYWMDKAREGQDIDLEKFNTVWRECEEAIHNDTGVEKGG